MVFTVGVAYYSIGIHEQRSRNNYLGMLFGLVSKSIRGKRSPFQLLFEEKLFKNKRESVRLQTKLTAYD